MASIRERLFFLLMLFIMHKTCHSKDWCLIENCLASLPQSNGTCSVFRLKDEKLELCCKYENGEVSYKKRFVPTTSYKQCLGNCNDNQVNDSCWKCMGCEVNPITTNLPTTTIQPAINEIEALRAQCDRFVTFTYCLSGAIAAIILLTLVFVVWNRRERINAKLMVVENVVAPLQETVEPGKQVVIMNLLLHYM